MLCRLFFWNAFLGGGFKDFFIFSPIWGNDCDGAKQVRAG